MYYTFNIQYTTYKQLLFHLNLIYLTHLLYYTIIQHKVHVVQITQKLIKHIKHFDDILLIIKSVHRAYFIIYFCYI